ncbi:phage tail protein [Thalassovita sp.]|uniref:phage tail protein n=1 Tax=Thalassovita sp. TaxID=1979401 RepID=UPI0029DE5CDA|nr:phage tail protein [Thalassovita sp.]
MPQVGAFFAGMFSAAAPAIGSATFGAWAAGAGVSGFLTTTVLGRLLSTVALTALSRALAPKPTVPGIRTTQTLTGGVTPASFILGRYATEGQLVCPPMSHGRDGGTPNAYLTYVIELGDVPGQTLEGVIVDGRACVPDSENPHADYGFPLPELSESRTRTQVVGSDPVDGYPIYDEVTTETPTAWVRYYDGTQVAADPMLMDRYGDYPERPWTADMVGTGICYAILTFRLARAIYTGFPQVRFVLGGIPLYDPRADDTAGGAGPQRREDPATWTPSENPAVQVYNILRGIALPGGHVWGGDMAAEDLPAGSWFAAMAAADAPVALDDEGASEPAWRSAYEVFVADEPAGVIEELLKPCSGQLAEIGGVWKIRLGGPGLPVFFFSDADVNISDSQQFDPFPALADTYNGVHASYPDPDALWNSVDAPPRYDASAEAADGHRRLIADLRLPACPYANQVQRVMRAYLEEERRMRRHVLTLAPEAIPLEPLDAVAWSSARNGYEAKIFEVVTIVDPLVTSKPQLSLRERDPADYDWQPGFALPVSLPSPATVPALPLSVGLWSVAPTSLRGADGTARRPGLLLSWQGADRDEAAGLRYRVRLAATQEVVATGQTEDATEGARVISEGVLPDTDYQVRVAWAARDGRECLWSDWAAVTTPDTRLAPPDLDPGVQGALSDAVSARADLDALTDGYTGTLAGTMAGLEASVDAAIAAAEAAVAPLGAVVPAAPFANWTNDSTSGAPAGIRDAAPAARFVSDDPVFGPAYDFPGNNSTLGPAAPFAFSPVAVYRLTARLRVTDDGSETPGVHVRLGITTFSDATTPAETNAQKTHGIVTMADGVQEITAWFSADLARLGAAGFVIGNGSGEQARHLSGSGQAVMAWGHIRVNGGATNGTARLASLEIRDVTAALDAADNVRTALQASVGTLSASLAQDYYTIAGVEGAIAAGIGTYDATVAGGLTATVSQTAAAVSALEGIASAAWVLRAEAGGSAADLELVAWSDVAGGGSAIRMNADKVMARGTLSADRLAVGLGGNLIEDPVWAAGTAGVGSWCGSAPLLAETTIGIRPPGTWAGPNAPTLYISQTGAVQGSFYLYIRRVGAGLANGHAFTVTPGGWYEVSAHVSTHRCGGQLQLRWRDRMGTDLNGEAGQADLAQNLPGDPYNPDSWPRYFAKAQAPAGAVMAQLVIRKDGTSPGGTDSWVFLHKPMLAATHEEATGPAPWSPGGQTTIAGDQIRTGAIRSANFVPGVVGWSIDTGGNAEFNSLITRGALIDGAASDGGAIVAHAGGTVAVQNTVAAVLATGPLQHGQLWQIGVMSEYRRHSSYSYEAKTTVTVNVETRFRVQTRVKSAGVWSGWATEFTAPYSSGPVWTSDNSLFSRMGSFEDMEIRLLCELSATPDPAAPGQSNIRNASVFARALER